MATLLAKAEPVPAGRGTRTDAAVLATLLLLFSSLAVQRYQPYSFLHGDGAMYATMVRALSSKGTLRMERFHPRSWYEQELGWNHDMDMDWSNVAVGRDGSWWPKHPFLLPIFALPLFLALGWGGLLVFNVLSTAVGLYGGYRLARRLLPAEPPSVPLLGLLLLLPWPLFTAEVYSLSNDLFYAALIVWGVERALARRPGLGGLLLGLAVVAKVTNILLVGPLLLWLLLRRHSRASWGPMLLGAALPLLALAIVQWVWFGAPWTSSYSRVLVRHGGGTLIADHATRFTAPSLAGLSRIWSYPGRGMEAYAPLLPLVLLGLLLPRRFGGLPSGPRLGIGVAVLLHGIFLSGYDYVHARFFTVVAELGIAPTGLLLSGLASLCRRALSAPSGTAATAAAPAGGAPEGSRRRVLVFAAVIATTLGLLAVLRALPNGPWRLSDHVEQARVFLSDGARGEIPCDYLNLYHQKWECSRKEAGSWTQWGHALAAQCQVGGERGPGVWAHPQPAGRAKRLLIDLPANARRIRLQAALDDGSRRRASVRVRFLLGEAVVWEPEILGRGAHLDRVVEIPEDPAKRTLQIEVPGQPESFRHLCVDAVVVK